MNSSKEQKTNNTKPSSFNYSYLLLIFASLLTVIGTFLISNSSLEFEDRTRVFASLLGIYIVISLIIYYLDYRRNNYEQAEEIEPVENESVFSPGVEEKLRVLEEANSFFATSLKSADMFRLVSNRMQELIPFTECVLFIADETKTKLKALHAVGENYTNFLKLEMIVGEGAPGKAFLNGETILSEDFSIEKKIIDENSLRNLASAIATPLCDSNSASFGIIALYSNNEKVFDAQTVRLFEAVAERISPLFLSSLTYERNLENALTDTLTNLPNERAFYLVLENQVAESQRLREQRPLTVLSIDIKNFDELNRKHGYGAADRVLTLTSKIIKGQLRQMDFLSRSVSDEFLAILPTATEEITKVIIERIEKAFRMNSFEINEGEKVSVQLNFGAASFIKDGETAEDLLKRAILKKQESKTGLNGSVLWFPREFVN